MSNIHFVSCDCEGCTNKANVDEWNAPTYHKLILGGSDFEMSTMSIEDREFDFCSLECLKKWIDARIFNDAESSIEKTIKEVKTQYPAACCVGTTRGGNTSVNTSHFRIWPTSGLFETRYIGIGNTIEEAWENALEKIKK